MKKIFTFLALTISFSMNAQITTEGTDNSGISASAIGFLTTASGDYSTAIGYKTTASGQYKHWNDGEGCTNATSGYSSVALVEELILQ